MKFKNDIAVLLACTLSMPASAGFLAGSQLFGYLDQDLNGPADYDSGVGTGYVLGVFDALYGLVICAPAGAQGITVRQVKQVVYNYMQKNPEKWNQSADVSVIAALKNTWPCAKK